MKQLTLFDEEQPKKESSSHHWQLFIDGASRKNPGLAGAGVYLVKNHEPVFKRGFFIGHRTNNQAEYLALLLGIFYGKKHMNPEDTITIFSDSELLILQMKGTYRVKDTTLQHLFSVVQQMLHNVHYKVTHIVRERNKEADAMANVGIDKKNRPPQEFLTLMHKYGINL